MSESTTITVAELKARLRDWPSRLANGEAAEVWVEHPPGLSNPVREILPLNARRAADGTWTSDLCLVVGAG